MVKLFAKNSNLCDHNSPTSQTDGQTTCDRNTALCTKVHRAVKTEITLRRRLPGPSYGRVPRHAVDWTRLASHSVVTVHLPSRPAHLTGLLSCVRLRVDKNVANDHDSLYTTLAVVKTGGPVWSLSRPTP